ncbi:hypothetical protein EJ07DRAFT_100393 [Lizonia empirigonia]|nr:hypothetical protein EJ07DRAFT_100393 [Lizonia empirigonia]
MTSSIRLWVALLWLAVIAEAGGLDDFSNNLATDLGLSAGAPGPLLSLFGDAITKQYLSESTSFEDYLIFALAPIGLVTAVVSVIRVCGGKWLRSFIGRAQEGNAAVEAELCTSTSKDICEVFNSGGITRTLGRAKILEIIRVPQPKDRSANSKDDLRNKEYKSAESVTRKSSEKNAFIWNEDNMDVNPNLSINVGIKKRKPAFVYSVLFLGTLLQLGLIIMAPLLSWVGGWSKDGRSEKKVSFQQAYSGNKSPVLFLVGSLFMTFGMFGSAYLIGQITQETKYRREDCDGRARTELFWVQAGDQVIGDQTYGPYAYSEDPNHPLPEYVISTKRTSTETAKRYQFLTWVTVVATLGGYIVQFVGLRDMSAWVSIAQLAAILIMSMFCGMMRTQRLANNGTRLQNVSSKVVGHELDWLAFKISGNMRRDEIKSQISSATAKNSTQKEEHSCIDCEDQTLGFSWIFTGHAASPPTILNCAEEILHVRARLGYLSGHKSGIMRKDERSQPQAWDEKYVAVRDRAVKMAKSLSAIADRLIYKQQRSKIHLYFQVQLSSCCQNPKPELHTIEVTFHPPDLAARRRG